MLRAGVLRQRLEPLREATAETAAACERLRSRQSQLAFSLQDLTLRKRQVPGPHFSQCHKEAPRA